jgi:hypothetical protein
VLAEGLNRCLSIDRVDERDHHPPVICHACDCMPVPPARNPSRQALHVRVRYLTAASANGCTEPPGRALAAPR